jgi:hypothetical protein
VDKSKEMAYSGDARDRLVWWNLKGNKCLINDVFGRSKSDASDTHSNAHKSQNRSDSLN